MNTIYIGLIGYFLFEDFQLDNPVKLLSFIIILAFVIYISFTYDLTKNNNTLTFLLGIIVLSFASFMIPELRLEGLIFLNIAFLTVVLSEDKFKKLSYIIIAFVLAVISLCHEYTGMQQHDSFNIALTGFLVIGFFACDLTFKTYIASRYNDLKLEFLREKNIVNEQYSTLFKNSIDPILLIDTEQYKITEVNHSGSNLLGASEKELIGKSLHDFLIKNNDSNIKLIEELEANPSDNHLETNRKIYNGNCVFQNKDNSNRYCQIQVIPVENKQGFSYLLCVDRTEEIQTKQQLEEASQDYRNIFDNNLLGVNSLDEESLIIKTNHSFCEMVGVGKEELIGKSITNFVHKDSIAEINELLLLLKKGEIQSFIQEIKFSRADGNVLQSLISVKGVYQKQSLIQAVFTVQDISQRKEIEKSLTQSELKYRKIFDNSLSGLALVTNWKFLDANKSCTQVLELEESEIIGKDVLDFVHPDDIEYARQEGNSLLGGDDIQKQIILRIMVGDKEKKLLVSMTESEDSLGEYDSIIILNFIDLTELLNMQTQLNERQAIYESLVSSSFTGIDVCEYRYNEQEGKNEIKLLYRNELLSNYLNDPNNENNFIYLESLQKNTPHRTVDGNLSSEEYYKVIQELINEKSANFEWSFKGVDGIRDFIVFVRLVQVDGKSLLIRNVLDVTEKRKKDNIILNQLYDINKKNEELEKYIESNLQLENFAYIASHDLKAPLRTVSSFAYLLKKNSYEHINSKGQKYLDIIISSSSSMQVLINDLLQFARINQDKLTIKRVDVQKFLNRCVEDIHQDIVDSKGKVEFLNLPNFILADEVKLVQLFQNLVRNGLKFRRQGVDPVIQIGCKENPLEWVFSVADNGIGIHVQDQEKIFGIFNKLHSNDAFEGTGLGLTICKKIVEKHGGTIWLESTVKQGTTFYFSVPKKEIVSMEIKQFNRKMKSLSAKGVPSPQ